MTSDNDIRVRSSKRIVLKRSFFERKTELVARELLGKILVHDYVGREMAAKIVEVEAYFGLGDAASHACNGPTPRSAIMFGSAGMAYVYLNYGVHNLLNVVTEQNGTAGAVLFRAVEPIYGIDHMLKLRPVKNKHDLTNGPGKLTKAMGIYLKDNGTDMTKKQSGLYITEGPNISSDMITMSPRIGISAGKEHLLRFHIKNNPFISRKG